MASVAQVMVIFSFLHQVAYLVCTDFSENHIAYTFRVTKLGLGGCWSGSDTNHPTTNQNAK